MDPDHSQERLNAIGKQGGGIVGITKMPTALCRWALSFNLRSHVAMQTREPYHLQYSDEINSVEELNYRQKVDTRQNRHEDGLYSALQMFGMFSMDNNNKLQNIVTKDLATPSIENALIKAAELRQAQLEAFVLARLLSKSNHDSKSLHDRLPKNNPPTFEKLP